MAPNATTFYSCEQVGPKCPVEATVLGYYPNLGINIFFAIGFGICGLIVALFGIWKKTWGYTAAVTAGCTVEFLGYVGRILLHGNPWDSNAFELQICSIIIAPTLMCISIYLTMKHICQSIAPELSRVRPNLYPFIFVPADVTCLIVQAVGGSMAALGSNHGSKPNPSLTSAGNRTIIAGICLQVVSLLIFGTTFTDFFWRAWKFVSSLDASPEVTAQWHDKNFRIFSWAIVGAYLGILIRCIYRIVEMANGWGNPIMQNEPSFIVLEGFMILLSAILLASFPPGIFFPHMAHQITPPSTCLWQKQKQSGVSSNECTNGMTQMNEEVKH